MTLGRVLVMTNAIDKEEQLEITKEAIRELFIENMDYVKELHYLMVKSTAQEMLHEAAEKKLAGITLKNIVDVMANSEASMLTKVILKEAVKDAFKTGRAKQAIVTAIQKDIEKNKHSRVLNALSSHIDLEY